MNLVPYIKACYPILYIVTPEESRAELTILNAAQECKRKIVVWSHTEGFTVPGSEDEGERIEDPINALEHVIAQPPGSIYVMRDLHPFFTAPRLIRMMRDAARDFKQQRKTMVIVSPVSKIPPELERDITVLEFDLPKREEIQTTFDNIYSGNKERIGEIPEDEQERIVQSAMGLTTNEAEAAFAKAIVEFMTNEEEGDKDPISKLVMKEKANAVKKSGILEYFEAKEKTTDIGGLENLKGWLEMRNRAFSKSARAYGLPLPRGILLVGLPGCGKSLSAKAASNILGVPLLKFDVGKVFGGLVGESESNMRLAIQTAEAVGSCVLWIDEMEKAFAGMGGSGSTDGGTSQRVFGNFITWMQEKTTPCFIIATVNRIDTLPAELLRKGRFDEIFFVGLPTAKEREEIIKIHVGKYGRDPEKFAGKELADLVKATDGFSGAELEEAVVSALYSSFHDDERELEVKDVEVAVTNTNPLSKAKSEQLKKMAEWAQKNAVNASKSPKSAKGQGGRQLEI
jgi:SpoVK/Ycf46/Vps4 family AAA+-type ATPase